MKKKAKTLSPEQSKVMRTLIIDNGSSYLAKVSEHVSQVSKEEGGNHKVEKVSIKKLKDLNDQGLLKDYIGGFHYIISSGSPRLRKYDADIHGKIAEYAAYSVFLGLCHGAQQYAKGAYNATLTDSKHMHRGQRNSEVKRHDPSLEGVIIEKENDKERMTHHGHHQNYIRVDKVPNELDVIAESISPHTKDKFVEMYKVKGKHHYGVQFHPEKWDGTIIKNLFRLAHKNYAKKT